MLEAADLPPDVTKFVVIEDKKGVRWTIVNQDEFRREAANRTEYHYNPKLGPETLARLPPYLRALACTPPPKKHGEAERRNERLEQIGLLYSDSELDRYTDEELDNARLLLLMPNSKCEVDGGSMFGTTYDLTGACPSCGAGARQTSAMFLNGWDDEVHRKLEGHRAAQTLRDELLVDDRIAAELESLAPTGLVLHQVYAVMPETKRQVKLAYKQLSADRILPPMSPPTEDVDRTLPCAVCTRSGWMAGSRLRVFYRKKDLESAGDVNLSWEGLYLGEVRPNPLECKIPVPMLLVTPKVMRVLRAAGVTEFDFIPIRVVDE